MRHVAVLSAVIAIVCLSGCTTINGGQPLTNEQKLVRSEVTVRTTAPRGEDGAAGH